MKSLMKRCAIALASAGGVGFSPWAPGTVGSALAVVAAWWAPQAVRTQLLIVGITTALGIWAGHVAAQGGDNHDPSFVVIDEVVGMWIACVALPHRPALFVAAFFLFRLFDIGKWFPMKQLERLPGGWGIMADDVAAGCLTWLVLIPWR